MAGCLLGDLRCELWLLGLRSLVGCGGLWRARLRLRRAGARAVLERLRCLDALRWSGT